jgi:protein-L-isoaspartate(D-aspartate) O-methyltransferase
MTGFELQRLRMVEVQLAERGIDDPRVLTAFAAVAREDFLPPQLAELAYEDTALLIGEGQTISQPYIVALTAQALTLRGDERVLEIGTGSGYAAAILGKLAREVVTVERIESLAEAAKERLHALGFTNVRSVVGDGSRGWPELAPYDAIAVAAAVARVPRALRDQLTVGGRLVIPLGADGQMLTRVTRKSESEWREEPIAEVRFVPLVSDESVNGVPGRSD